MTRSARARIRHGVAIRALALAMPAAVLGSGTAMATDSAATAASEAAADQGQGLRIQEVIVTSRKREESVQRVPIAMTAITGQLQVPDIRDLTDIVAFTPNVRIDPTYQRANAADITIRGISPTRTDDNSIDSPIGVLIDGVYLGSLPGQIIENFDVDRIEVLRGPQGTLFGRNTVGGAVNVFRTEPTGEWGAKVQYTTGSWNDQEFRGVFNAPIIKDILALKLYFISENRDGYLHNTFLNINQPQKNYKNFGGELKFTPNDWFKALLIIDKYEDRSQGGAFLGNYNFCAGVLPVPTNVNDVNLNGGLLDTFLPAAFGLPNVPCRTSTAIPSTISDNFSSPGDVQTWAYTLNMTAKLNSNLRVVSVTGYRTQHELASEDFDGSSDDFITIATDAHYHQFSEELRLEGNWDQGFGKLNLVGGAYYWNSYFNRGWVTGGDFWSFVSDLSGYDLNNNTWLNPTFAASTGFSNPIAACLAPRTSPALQAVFGRVQCDPGVTTAYGPLENKLYETQGTESVAFFAHGDWEFYPKFTLTAGVRYTYEKKDFVGYQAYITPDALVNVNNFPSDVALSNSWQRVTPTAALSYQMTDDVLFYASFSEGWHSGGFFGVNQNTADFIQNQYKPETAQSYEIGMKGQFFEHRVQLNLDGFINDFQNKQESAVAFDPTTNTVVTLFTNVGGVRYEGIEAELQWIITRRLHLQASFGYLNAKYTSLEIGYPNAVNGNVPVLTDATFLVPRGAPKFTAGGSATYSWPVGPGELQLESRVSWVDMEYGDIYNSSQSIVPAHTDLSVSASYSWKNYKVTGFGRNLTNWRYEAPAFVAPLFASSTITPGASWGLELLAKF
jgi:iron complex outermembrane receptor protein